MTSEPPGPTQPSQGGQPPPAPFQSRMSPRARAGLFWPVALILVGVVALLLNLGIITGDQLARLVDIWPLALILLGLVLVFRSWLPRLALPLTLVVAVLAIVGAAAYAALPAVYGPGAGGGGRPGAGNP